MISRRGLLVASAATLACGRRKATAYQGYCFVANRTSRNIAVVDLTSFRMRKSIALDAEPSAVLADPAKPRAYVLAPDAGTVYEIDANGMSISRRARAGNTAVGMRVAPRKDAIWVLYRDPAMLVELPFDTLRPRRKIRLDAVPDDFDLSQFNQAAIASSQSKSVTLASLEHSKVERTLAFGAEPSFTRFRSDGKVLLVADGPGRSATFFDTASGRIVVRLPLPFEPREYCVTPDQGQIFLSGPGMDAVAIVFPFQTELWQTVLAGREPGAMAATPPTATSPPYLLVTNPSTNTLTVLDLSTYIMSAVVEVGTEPRQVLITPDNRWALVLNQQSGDMAVIRLDRLSAASSQRVLRYKSAPIFTMVPVGVKPVAAAVVAW